MLTSICKMALPLSMATYCRLAELASGTMLKQSRWIGVSARRCYITTSCQNRLQFKLDERTAHCSLELYKRDTAVIYQMLGPDPSRLPDSQQRFRDWAVVLGDARITAGRHYWEVTIRKSTEFRLGVAEASMSRDECVGTNSASWVFAFVHRRWFAMTMCKLLPVALPGKPERVGVLLDYEAGRLSLVDTQNAVLIHSMKAKFHAPLCPAFALWDGELITHSGLEVPPGLA